MRKSGVLVMPILETTVCQSWEIQELTVSASTLVYLFSMRLAASRLMPSYNSKEYVYQSGGA